MATAPNAPIPPAPNAPTATPTDAIGRTLRHDGWTPERQQLFLRLIAEGHTTTDACGQVGLSTSSAYSLRDRAAGAGFALGWEAANLRARAPIADALLARAVHGQVEWRTRPDGERVERFRFDNGLASRMLARLDVQAAADGPAGHRAARIVADEFEAYLHALGRDDGPARAGLFVAERTTNMTADDIAPIQALARADRFARAGAALATEVDVADLDPGARATWTGEQWVRAEAAGLVTLAREPTNGGQQRQLVTPDLAAPADGRIWFDEDRGDWRTDFAPPPGFDGLEEGDWGEDNYERELTDAEQRLVEIPYWAEQRRERAEDLAERDRWFATATAEPVANGLAGEDDAADEGGESGEGRSDAAREEPMPEASYADPADRPAAMDARDDLVDVEADLPLAEWVLTADGGLQPANPAAMAMDARGVGLVNGPSIRAV